MDRRSVLNEVLSLNAQEFSTRYRIMARCPLLNEVLSLNAQEFCLACLAKQKELRPQ